jgi:hypothetical protein
MNAGSGPVAVVTPYDALHPLADVSRSQEQ